jgi:hypothetical protein
MIMPIRFYPIAAKAKKLAELGSYPSPMKPGEFKSFVTAADIKTQ